jgi:hypothetical protein
MRFKKALAMLAATLFAAAATACASMPANDEGESSSSSSRHERDVPHGYF